jgi:uncharacterized low-complexity protein
VGNGTAGKDRRKIEDGEGKDKVGKDKVDRGMMDGSKADESKVDESKVDESKVNKSKVDEGKAGEGKVGEDKVGEDKADEIEDAASEIPDMMDEDTESSNHVEGDGYVLTQRLRVYPCGASVPVGLVGFVRGQLEPGRLD